VLPTLKNAANKTARKIDINIRNCRRSDY
jgi:hypothetical protein